MSLAGWATLLASLAGVITAVATLLRQLQSEKTVQAHMQLHATDAHPGPDGTPAP